MDFNNITAKYGGTLAGNPSTPATPTTSTTQPITPTSSPDFSAITSKYGGSLSTAPTTTDTSSTQDKGFLGNIDDKLSNMSGLVGGLGSGIYNAGKGLLRLGGAAVADTFDAINHPIDSGKAAIDFIGGELSGGANPESLDTLGNFIQNTVGSKGLLGVAQLPGKAINEYGIINDNIETSKQVNMFANMSYAASKNAENATDPVQKQRYLDAAKQFQNTANSLSSNMSPEQLTQGKILGTAMNGALTALTFGEGNLGATAVEKAVDSGLVTAPVGQILKNAVTSSVGRSLQSGGIMTGFQAGSNLQEGRPVGENLDKAFFTGVALPGVTSAISKLSNKIVPTSASTDTGATALKQAIGFRGNIKEKQFFDNAAPVVYNELKNTGFKVTDSTDPNNLINLDKAISDNMTKILQERMDRIKATGGDVVISGSLAADKIRNLVERGSVEDLTNPNVRTALDSIAKNFEGKQYSPIEAQKAIVQANTGFSLSDNPAMSKQIKMAISQAFTPELDRIVAGKDKITYDNKGRPIPADKGTAELSKKWSAFKTVSDQLQKKISLEDRKATYNLPNRLTGAEIAGKVGEAVGNPMIATQKLAGATFQSIANKLMGDRNNVNYRIYKAFNGKPVGMAIINMLNKFNKAQDLMKFLAQNPLILHVLEKLLPTDSTLESTKTTKVPVTSQSIENKIPITKPVKETPTKLPVSSNARTTNIKINGGNHYYGNTMKTIDYGKTATSKFQKSDNNLPTIQ